MVKNTTCTCHCTNCDKIVEMPLRNEEGLIHVFLRCPTCGEILWITDKWKRRRADIKKDQLEIAKYNPSKDKQTTFKAFQEVS